MGQTTRIALLALALMAAAARAHADSLLFGVAARCDTKDRAFELAAVAEFNEQTTVVSPRLDGMRMLRPGKHRLVCGIGKERRVVARLEIWPASNRRCLSSGYVALHSLSVGGTNALESPSAPFNFVCPTQHEILVSLTVRGRAEKGGVVTEIRRCTAKDWTRAEGYVELNCTQEQLR